MFLPHPCFSTHSAQSHARHGKVGCISLISSCLDYCNSLLYGSSQANIHKLQRVQNVIAKLVCASNACSSDALYSLHWLPINQRIKFKLASLTFKLLQHQSPSYLASLIIPYLPSRALRTQGQQLLAKPHVKTAIGSRPLRVAASTIWNSLPLHVRQSPSFDSFKRNLKTIFSPVTISYLRPSASDSNNCS